jgi:hypothetical protein
MVMHELFPEDDSNYSVEKVVQKPVADVVMGYLDAFFADEDAKNGRLAWVFSQRKVLGIWPYVDREFVDPDTDYSAACLKGVDEVYLQLCGRGVQGIGISRTERGTEIGRYDFCKGLTHVEL